LPCYTFDGTWGELFDVRAARRIARMLKQDFETIRADGRFLKGFPDFAERTVYISDGTHDALGAHDIYFNQRARDIAPVRLTGKFGSEIVRTRPLIATMSYARDFLGAELRSRVEALPSLAAIHQHAHPLTRVVAEAVGWHEFGRVSIEQSQLVLRTPYMDNDFVKLMFRAPAGVRAAGTLQEQYVKDMSPRLASIPTNLGSFISNSRLVTKIAYALSRVLFKVEYIYLYAAPHWLTLVDRKLARLQPERILSGRQKWEGYRIWFNTDFSEFVNETLLNSRAHLTQFFDKHAVKKIVERHLAGTHNYMNEINRALTVELICSTLLNPK